MYTCLLCAVCFEKKKVNKKETVSEMKSKQLKIGVNLHICMVRGEERVESR
jgi:hypothetical protein